MIDVKIKKNILTRRRARASNTENVNIYGERVAIKNGVRMMGTKYEDRQCEPCPSIKTEYTTQLMFSIDGFNCNVTEQDLCERITNFDCTFRRRIPGLSGDILGDILAHQDPLTGVILVSLLYNYIYCNKLFMLYALPYYYY